MKKLSICTEPYDEGLRIYEKDEIEIREGLTVLVGCNGSGKTTLLRVLKDKLKGENIPVLLYDNTQRDSSKSKRNAMLEGDISLIASSMVSSEGENIIINMGCVAKDIGKFVRSGKNEDDLTRVFRDIKGIKDDEVKEIGEYWILLDAVDSGLSVDNVLDLKKYLFTPIMEDIRKKGKEVYIVVSANEYEMCRGEQCFDVQLGEYVDIKGYEDFRELVLRSREKKDKILDDYDKRRGRNG